MTPRGRYARRRTVAAAAAVLLGGLCLALGTPAPGKAATDTPQKVQVRVDSISPQIPKKGDTLTLTGELINTTGSTASSLEIQLWQSFDRAPYRSALTDLGKNADTKVDATATVGSSTLAPHASTTWRLSIPVRDLQLQEAGVYGIAAAARGSLDGADVTQLGITRTYLPWDIGSTTTKPPQIAVVWPITAAPKVDGNQETAAAQNADASEELSDNEIGTEVAANGRLSKLVTPPAAGVALSWLVDPDLITTIKDMVNGYQLAGGHAGQSGLDAQNWLAKLAAPAAKSAEVWTLPAGDPDLGSLTHSPDNLAATMLGYSTQLALTENAGVASLLGVKTPQTLAWPGDGAADVPTLRLAAQLHPDGLLVSGDSVPVTNKSYTPTGRTSLDGMRAVVSDPQLDAVFAGDPADAATGAPVTDALAEQRLLAETAVVAYEVPEHQTRTLVIAPPRDLPVSTDVALLHALGAASSGSGRWLTTVPLSKAFAAAPDPDATTGPAIRPPSATNRDLTASQLQQTKRITTDLDLFLQILTNPARAKEPFDPAVLRTVSASWRGNPDGQTAFAGAVSAGLDRQSGLVRLIAGDSLTLSGKSGKIPVSVSNKLGQQVRVRLKVTSELSNRLSVSSPGLLTLDPGTTEQIQVTAKAKASGETVAVDAQLLTPDGDPYGRPSTIQVRVTTLGTTALIVVFASAALLVGAVVFRVVRATRKAK